MNDLYRKREEWFDGIFVLGWLVPVFCIVLKHLEMGIISLCIWIVILILGCIWD